MAWRTEKTAIGQDLVWDEVEKGIAPSPTQGTANIQNANISTESGEILASFGRTSQTPQAITNGTLTPDGATNFTGPSNLSVGQWISVSASTVTSISTTTSPTTVSIEYLAVGGGGGGGGADVTASDTSGGGGGAGQFATSTASFSVQSYAITVGGGGAGGVGTDPDAAGVNGSQSVIAGVVTAAGGGGGGAGQTSNLNGKNGASGGGAGGDQGGGTGGTGGTGSAGNNGGNGDATGNGGGGGGSTSAGANSTGVTGGAGGTGTASSITGTSVTYSGGGGGGASDGSAGSGGSGGGGNGGFQAAGSSATANTGGGGGGAGRDNAQGEFNGGNGGSGIVVLSYPTGSCIAVGGVVTYTSTNTVHTFTTSGTFAVLFIPPTNRYYVSYKSGTTYKLSAKFDPTGANALTHGTTGSVTFSTVAVPNSAIAKSTEKYTTATGVEYRYYVLDVNSYLWVFDTLIFDTYGTQWMLPDPNNYSAYKMTGVGVLNGMVMTVGMGYIFGKPVNDLGRLYNSLTDLYLNEPFPTHRNFALVGNQGKLYYCDGNYIGEVFPTTSLITSIANIQSTCKYTGSSTTGTVSYIVTGSIPYSPDETRIPVVFYTDVYGTQPTNLTQGTVYYIDYDPLLQTFQVYAASSGGSAIDIATGAAGNQFFTTFWPFGSIAGVNGSAPTLQASTQRVNLPANEVAQCMVEVGNTVLIGGITNVIYPWNQIDATPSDFITLPEADIKTMINVNNLAYVFAGNKGNIYITNNSVASFALKVPDYCAGIAGTPLTYIEPYFTWGDAMYLRGRVYFSILDQTATKAGNCGGNWSFIPSQNVDPAQDIGSALRLENQNSYGDYDGYSTILIPNEEQQARPSPYYWAWWQDSYSTGTSNFGVDQTSTNPVTTYVTETDLLKTGSLLGQQTFSQVEYDLTTPLASGDSVQLYYRTNSTDAWTTCGTVIEETTNKLAGYYKVPFQKTQWIQFRAVITTGGTTSSSFVRLKQIRLR